MNDKSGFTAFEKRIEELLKKTGHIPPHEILALLQRADGNPAADVEKELERLLENREDG